jgi:methionine-rich copper-binding protein CopC
VTADTTADGSGAYTVQVAITSLQDGDLTATVIATDGAGNPSDPGTGHVMKDTGAPDAPSVVITPSSINSGNANAVTVSGDTEPGNAVHISVDDTDTATSALTGDTFANGAGHYSLPFDMTSLSDGTITATATAKDAANNIGPSGQGTATKNTGAPQLVSTSPAANSTVQPPADVRATFNEPLDQAQSTLVVKNKNNNTVAGTTTFAPGGRTIIFTPSSALTDAGSPYTATYNVKDVVDNNTTGSFTFTVDSVPPAAPTSVLLSPDPIGPTNMAAVTGSAQPGSTVNVSVDDTFGATPPETGQTTAAENGSFSVPINVSTLGDGVLTATVTATDAAGNTGPSATDTATKDTTSPTGTTVTKSPTAANIVTSPAITISGTTEPLASVLISIGDGGVSTPLTFTTAADGTGNYSHTFDVTPLTDGTLTVLATATDAAGNSAAAASTTMPKDTVAPNAPTLVLPAKVTHANVASVPFSGTAEEASALIMTVNDASTATPQIVGQTTVGNDGAWSLTRDLRPLRNGTLTVKAAVRDAVGNMSPITTKSLAKDSRPTTTLSLTVFPSTVTDGAAVRMFGTLKDQDGVKLGGKTVTLTYVSSPQTRRFAVTTKSDGTYSLTTKLHYNGRITATFAADSVAKGSASVPRSLTVRRQVVVQSPANGATVPAGSLITIKGYITPITSGLNIALSESGVGDIGYAKTAPDGTFSLREAFAKGRHVLTVRVSGTGANARNSRTFVITAQ